MIDVINIFLIIVGFLFLIVISVDFYQWIRLRISHHCIGEFMDIILWENAVSNCAKKWIKKMPTIPLKDENRFIVFDMLRKQYKHSSAQGWQYAELLAGVYTVDKTYQKEKSFVAKNEIREVDEGYVIYFEWCHGIISEKDIQDIMKKYLSIIRSRTHKNGLIEYRIGYGNICIADTIAFVCPLLIRWGNFTGNSELVDLALKQIESFHRFGYIREYGLYAHAYDGVKSIPCESIGWGRGTGWYALGILYSYHELRDTDYKDKVWNYIIEAADNIIKFQCEDGGWCTEMISQYNYDASATAIFGYFLSEICHIKMNIGYYKAAKSAIFKLQTTTRKDGAIEYCEGNCHGVGKYSKRYSISPFTQGMTLKLIDSLNNI